LCKKRIENISTDVKLLDEVAVAVAIDPNNVVKQTESLRITVELHNEFTRGQLAVDWTENKYQEDEQHYPGQCKNQRSIEMVTKYDVSLIDNMMIVAISRSEPF